MKKKAAQPRFRHRVPSFDLTLENSSTARKKSIIFRPVGILPYTMFYLKLAIPIQCPIVQCIHTESHAYRTRANNGRSRKGAALV